MSKFLFTVWEGGGETPPILSIVRATVDAGHDVTALADDVLGPDVEATGAEWIPWATAPNKGVLLARRGPRARLGGQDAARRVPALPRRHRLRPRGALRPRHAAEIARRRPDVVVNPALMFGAQAATEAAGIPQAMLLTCSYVVPGPAPRRTAAAGRRRATRVGARATQGDGQVRDAAVGLGPEPLNAARQEHGLAPVAHPLDQIHAAERFLVLTSPAFDFPVPDCRPTSATSGRALPTRRGRASGRRRPATPRCARRAQLDLHGPGRPAAADRHGARHAARTRAGDARPVAGARCARRRAAERHRRRAAPHTEVLKHAAPSSPTPATGRSSSRWPPACRWWRCRWGATSPTTPRGWSPPGRASR